MDKPALLAFVYYDTTHAGYIVSKDLEEMIYTLGLQLSRAQVTLAIYHHTQTTTACLPDCVAAAMTRLLCHHGNMFW